MDFTPRSAVSTTSTARRTRARVALGFPMAFVLVVSAFGAGPALAGGDGNGSVDGDRIEAQVRFDGDDSDTPGCSWAPVTGVDPVTGTLREMPTIRRRAEVTETLYERTCDTVHTLHWVRDDTARRMATHSKQRVSRLIPMLVARTAPPADKLVVNVGTWFWVPRLLWKPVRVTATIPTPGGPIIVTTTATPTVLSYSPGDGSAPASCRGPGPRWNSGLGDSAVSPCMYTYRSASHRRTSGVFDARFTIQWEVRWSSNLGIGGRLPNVRLGLGTKVRVLELQALTR